MGKDRLAMVFTKMYGRLSFFRTNIFRFSHVKAFGYDNRDNDPNEGTVTFWAKCGTISPSPRKQGDEPTNPITGY